MPKRRIGVLGSGPVGQTLADGLLRHGFEVMRGTRQPDKLASWLAAAGTGASTGTFEQAARYGASVVLAVKGSAAESVLALCRPENLEGKLVIDATNPIADDPPTEGVIRFFTGIDDSLLEQLQRRVPGARFVKAFSCVGHAYMVEPDFGGLKPTMFICGNDAAAKDEVRAILDRFGWETEDMGGAQAARAIEPLCMLWCIPGFLRNEWSHAFKLLKK